MKPRAQVGPLVMAFLAAGAARAQEGSWNAPAAAALTAPQRSADGGPVLACTPTELQRLRAALADAALAPLVRAKVDAARRQLAEPLQFPPRGARHNQWYQCDACQVALQTVDDTHHRCPRCEKIYSGPPYDDVLFARAHGTNLARALGAAWAFALTGERAFGDDAAAVLLGYAQRYEGYPYHANAAPGKPPGDSGGHVYDQTLTEAASFATQIAPAIDLVWPHLDEAQRSQVLAHLVRPLVENVAKCSRGTSNWQTWHNAAMFAGGVLLGDDEWLRRAVLAPKQGFAFQLATCVSAEGMWHENSWGYHLYTLRGLVAHAEAARAAGIDLWRHPGLRRMVALPVRYALADGSLPRLGDDVSSRADQVAPLAEIALAATGDPVFTPALPRAASFDSVRFGRAVAVAGGPANALPVARSELFADAGHALLRRGQGDAASSAMLVFGPFGGFHGHFDKLSFVWHALGTERGVDPGRAASQAYRLPIHNGWYRATVAHDAVVVDGRSQPGASGELLGFVDGEAFTAAAARTEAYRGVEHRRCLLLDERCLIVLDLLRGTGEHTFDFVYHDAAPRVACTTAATAPEQPLGFAGEEFVTWLGAGRSGEAIAVRFDGEPVGTRLWTAGAPGTEVRIDTGPFRSVTERAPLVLLRRTGDRAVFATVLEAVRGDGPGHVAELRAAAAGAGIALEFAFEGRRETVTWDGDDGIAWSR